MLSYVLAAVAEAIVTFDNGMVGTITKGGKVALVAPNGAMTATKYMPQYEDYAKRNSPIRIEHSIRIGKDEYYYETVWVDDEWDFENNCWDFDGVETSYQATLNHLNEQDALLKALFKCRVTEVRLAA